MKCGECREVDVGTKGSTGGVSRRDFLKVCSAAAVYMGLPATMGPKIAEAATAKRLPVIWVSGQECTGCTETLLRADHPDLVHLILDLISLEYSETLNAGAGDQAEAALQASVKAGGYVMVMEGSIPLKDGGIYCKIGGRPVVDIAAEVASSAAAVIGIGSCASWGGMPSATAVDMGNESPTGAVGIAEALKAKGVKTPVVNIPGCPPNGYNFLSTVLYFVTFGKLPEVDDKARPKFAYSRLIHENCERRPHFDAGRFAEQFGDDGHRQGYCLYKLGCKGPETFNNCSTLTYNDVGASAWPVGMGAPCFGCSEADVGFTAPLHSPARPIYVTPPTLFPGVDGGAQGKATTGGALVGGAVIGAVVGAGIATAKKTAKKAEEES
jgi:hydrogenase small subunit